MNRVLAALEPGPSLEPVARAARAIAAIFAAEPFGIHVVEAGSPPANRLQDDVGFPVTLRSGPVVDILLQATDTADVAMAVVGTRSHLDTEPPTGHVTLQLAEQTTKPLLVVPPRSALGARGAMRRVLVPLDGAPHTSVASRKMLQRLTTADIEVTATHVLSQRDDLHFVDAPQHAYDAWRREFIARHAEPGTRLDLRRGAIWQAIQTCASDMNADLVVLAWSQYLSPGRAVVVREALANPTIPILLLPASRTSR